LVTWYPEPVEDYLEVAVLVTLYPEFFGEG